MTPREVNLESLDLRYGRLRVVDRRQEARLMASIEEHGQQDAIIVVLGDDRRFIVMDGHKRVRVLRRLRKDVVMVVVWELDATQALVAAYRAGSAASYNAIEEGWLVYELHRVGKWDLGKAAASMGRSRSWASRRLGLVEELPEGVVAAVKRGEIGAWAAMKHLLPLARANASACERLAEKMMAANLSSREVGLVCGHYAKSGAQVRERILSDPAQFLKVLEAACKGTQDPALSEAENRVLKQMELIGNVALGLTRGLPQALGYDAGDAVRVRLWSAWDRSRKRFEFLDETVAALKAAREKNKEDGNAQSGNADSRVDVAQAGSRQSEDRQGLGSGAQRCEGGDCERSGGGEPKARSAAPVGAAC